MVFRNVVKRLTAKKILMAFSRKKNRLFRLATSTDHAGATHTARIAESEGLLHN